MSTIGAAHPTLVASVRGLRCWVCGLPLRVHGRSLLRPDYDAASMFISELSLGPWGWVQIVNFMVFGLALLVFAMSVALEFGGEARTARVGVTLLVIMGISMLASGPFVIDPVAGVGPVIDPVAVAPHQMSFHSKFHYALGTLFFLLAPATCFCFAGYKRSSKDPALRAFRRWSFGIRHCLRHGRGAFQARAAAARLEPAAALAWSDPARDCYPVPRLAVHLRPDDAQACASGASLRHCGRCDKFRGLATPGIHSVILPSIIWTVRD